MLFKKNPILSPEIVSFVFFDESIEPNLDEICSNARKLLKATGALEKCTVEVLEQTNDQIGLLIGENCGCLLVRMPGEFPAEKLDPDDPNRQRVLNAHEHWGIVALVDNHPMVRLNSIIKVSVLMQAVSISHSVRGFIPSPAGVVFRASEWSQVIKRFVQENTVPLRQWIGFDYREEDGHTDAATLHMDDLFDLPNVEILDSERGVDETVDLLECAVIDSIMNGAIHKRSKRWATTTGVEFKARYAKSIYYAQRKSTHLREIVSS
jgi:hypothetical protein